MTFCWLLLATASLSLVLTGLLRHYALAAQQLMDIPNARSAHVQPTPRGGGAAIALSFLLALLPLYWLEHLPLNLVLALLGAGSGIALLGLLDDRGHIPARWRLLGHFAGAIWVLYWLGGIPPLHILGLTLQPNWLGQGLLAIGLVWLLNLYNFMDGLDGLASLEAIFVCLGGALLYLLAGASAQALPALLLACAVAGFLVWNFPPARIFMGDAGSGFLGISLGTLMLQAAWTAPSLLWGWLILLGVFIVDATVTLLHRLVRGEKIYEAHRSHAYQYAARQYNGHRPVTLSVLAINLGWLLPVAVWVVWGGLDGLSGMLLAYAPLLLLALRFQAGRPERSAAPTQD